MRRQLNNVISVVYTFIKFTIIKLFHWKGFSFSPIERFSPNVATEFNNGSIVVLEKMVRVHSGCKIKVRRGAKLKIGNSVKINYNCIIACHDEIAIGKCTEFGPAVFLYDHDHDYREGLKENKFKTGHIIIGENCWIGANTVILRDTELGNNCVVGAGCVLRGCYPDNSIIIQKRTTEVRKYST